MSSTLALNGGEFRKRAEAQGLTTIAAIADAMSYDKGSVSRVIARRTAPGPKFIAKTLTIFSAPFDDLFEVVDDDTALAAEPKVAA